LNSVIKKFSDQGEFLMKLGSSDPKDPMYLQGVTAIAVNSEYEIFAMDQPRAEVKRFEVEKNDSSVISADGRQVIDNPAISNLPTFTGATEPYAKVKVTVRSDPVTCEAVADANGNWSCTLPTELPAGQHAMEASILLANDSILELGPYPVRVLGGIGTPGTSLGEGLLAPNTGLLVRTPISAVLSISALIAIISLIVFGFVRWSSKIKLFKR
jgi:hypothetical protein